MEMNTSGIEQFIAKAVAAYRDLVSGHSVTAIDRVRQCLADYRGTLLPEIDRRLGLCNELLRKGLREEAIDYARDRPDLIRVSNLCDFRRFGADFDAWNRAASGEGVAAWPLPKVAYLKELLAAERESYALKPFVEQWRRLNIARAPLQRRIEVLQELRKRDPNCTAWAEMLREFEEYRLTEIEAGVRRLRQASLHDETAFQFAMRLAKELASPWGSVPQPRHLLAEVQSFLERAKDHDRKRRLADLAGKIRVASEEDSRLALGKLLAQWAELVLTPEEADQYKDVTAIEKKFVDAERLDRIMRGLELSVGERPNSFGHRFEWRIVLERLWFELEGLTSEVAIDEKTRRRLEMLHDRVWEEVEAVDRQQSRRQLFRFAAFAASVLVLVGAVALYNWLSWYDRTVAWCCQELNSAIASVKSGGLDEKPDSFEGWSPWFLENNIVKRKIDELEGAWEVEANRKEKVTSGLASLEGLVKKMHEEPRADPLASWPESFRIASQTLAELQVEGVVLREFNQAKVERFETQIKVVAEKWLGNADRAFEKKVQLLQEDVEALVKRMRNDLSGAGTQLENYDVAFEGLAAVASRLACPHAANPYANTRLVSADAAKKVSSESELGQDLKDARRLLLKLNDLEELEQVADRQLEGQQYGAYAQTLRGIAADLKASGSPEAVDYKVAADFQPAWEALSRWGEISEKLVSPVGLSAEGCHEILELLGAVDENVMKIPEAKVLRELQKSLEERSGWTVGRAQQMARTLEETLEGRFGLEIDGVVWPQGNEQSEFEYYYCLLQDRPQAGSPSKVQFLKAWKIPGDSWPKSELQYDPRKHFTADAPQHELANACIPKVRQLEKSPESLMSNVVHLMSKAIDLPAEFKGGNDGATPKIDPLVHVRLLRELVHGCVGDDARLKRAFQKTLQVIPVGGDVLRGVRDQVFVLAPQVPPTFEATDARMKCREFIKQLSREVRSLQESLAEEKEQFDQIEVVWYEPAGRLQKREDGRWLIRGGDNAARANNQLFFIREPFAGSRVESLVQCDGDGQLPPGVDLPSMAGSPVFLRRERKIGDGGAGGGGE